MESLSATLPVLEAPLRNILAEALDPNSTRPNESTVKRLAPVEDARESTDLVVVPTTVSDDIGEVVPIPNDPVVVSEALTLPAVIRLRPLLSVVPSTAVALKALPFCTKALSEAAKEEVEVRVRESTVSLVIVVVARVLVPIA